MRWRARTSATWWPASCASRPPRASASPTRSRAACAAAASPPLLVACGLALLAPLTLATSDVWIEALGRRTWSRPLGLVERIGHTLAPVTLTTTIPARWTVLLTAWALPALLVLAARARGFSVRNDGPPG
jgi:hypothetical protein